MKNIYKFLLIGLSSLTLFAGCAKEEVQDPYAVNWAYLETPMGMEFDVKFNTLGEWVAKMDTVQKFTRFRCTKPAPSTVTATIAIDESLVAEYNKKNGTSYEILPGASLETTEFVIEKGQYVSADTIKVRHEGWEIIQEAGNKTYLLPITMSSLNGNLKKSEHSTFYLIYDVSELLGYSSAYFEGTEISDKSAWTATSSTGVSLPKTIDCNQGNYTWIRSGGAYQDGTETIVLDMGTTYRVKSFGLIYYAWYYSCADYTLEYSVDGENYVPVGFFENPGNKTLVTVFYDPVEARYFRFQNGISFYSESYGALINEICVYTE